MTTGMGQALNQSHDQVRVPRRMFDRPIGFLFKGYYFIGRGVQISEGGTLIAIDLALATGDMFVMTMILPAGRSIVVRAEIAYRKPKASGPLPEFGAKFVNLKLIERRHIRDYVSAKTRQEADTERSRR